MSVDLDLLTTFEGFGGTKVPIGANRSDSEASRHGGIAKLRQTGPSLRITENPTACAGR